MTSRRFSERIFQAWWWIPGLGVFGAGLYFLLADVPKFNVLWYLFGWYGYLLVLDAVIYLIQGESFISHRRRELLAMLFWSIPFWFLYEAYNFVLQNWYYVFALRTDFLQGVLTFIAFATVYPACFFHAELLKALNLFTRPFKSIDVNKGLKQFALYFGIACIFVPLIIPRYSFWMVWGAVLGVPAVLNYYNGAPSMLRDFEEGRPGRFYRLLIGGMMAGLLWEGLNYFARCKWIYTVPGMEEVKLFEMPIPGFIGFPVLAIGAFAFYSMFSHYFRGGRTWEKSDALQIGKTVSKWNLPVGVISMGLSALVFIGILHYSMQSQRPLLIEYPGITTAQLESLEENDIHTPELLFNHVNREGIAIVASQTDINQATLDSMQRFTSLVLHKGMGTQNAALLQSVGIQEASDLIGLDAWTLHQRILEILGDAVEMAPRRSEVQVWIRAAELSGGYRR